MKGEETKLLCINNECHRGKGGTTWRKILKKMTTIREVPTDGDMSTDAERTGEKMTTLGALS